ncbi:PREDICTED: uncharacterized protein LOC104799179 [Tarenaya hassleriana]|uniref:uncharacterized protein LOC104799179 n=1 Tax=Tarenaya hassleriana TaxID=28532 RepID=UPI00053C6350|nr:PREDICTED: uncharacterized protein LOC104799179 [Tarenaya hassleriana]XP_010519865.1 PREDICTED: uncharacterized protein LOC104799179 [Tarenaya hassleriana]
MERDSWSRLNGKTNAVTSPREIAGPNAQIPRAGSSDLTRQSTSSELVPQWGNRKRLRCMKVLAKDESIGSAPRFDRPVLTSPPGNGYSNLRQRSHSLVPPVSHRILRNLENSGAMRGQKNNSINDSNANKPDGAAHDSKKGGGEAAVWPGRFMIGLTNKEKEEDFWVLKGSKLPQRPKKRAKLIQRTLNLVSPGTWLCDLTLERYEVRERKASKKRPRGLKAMTTIDSESE